MAEYERPTSDFVTSTLSGAIAAGDATATIGAGLDLPATNGILQIDYDSTVAVGLDNGPETISYATYTSATGALAGMTRGLNGTTGVAHANGSKVQCGFSVSYFGGAMIKNDDLETTAGEPGGAWKTWTPTLANMAVGTGGSAELTAYYTKVGKTVTFVLNIVLGTSGQSVGTTPTFTLPSTPAAKYFLYQAELTAAGNPRLGEALSSPSTAATNIFCFDSTTAYNSRAGITATVPATWAAGDKIRVNGTYEEA